MEDRVGGNEVVAPRGDLLRVGHGEAGPRVVDPPLRDAHHRLRDVHPEHGRAAEGFEEHPRVEPRPAAWLENFHGQPPFGGGLTTCVNNPPLGGRTERRPGVRQQVDGGEPLTLCDLQNVGTAGFLGVTWSPDGESIVFAYLPIELSKAGTRFEIEFFGEWTAAVVVQAPLWDPKGERIKA